MFVCVNMCVVVVCSLVNGEVHDYYHHHHQQKIKIIISSSWVSNKIECSCKFVSIICESSSYGFLSIYRLIICSSQWGGVHAWKKFWWWWSFFITKRFYIFWWINVVWFECEIFGYCHINYFTFEIQCWNFLAYKFQVICNLVAKLVQQFREFVNQTWLNSCHHLLWLKLNVWILQWNFYIS